ncbi:uncharacterized protein ISCGN_022612 [Ixodes scapularis]
MPKFHEFSPDEETFDDHLKRFQIFVQSTIAERTKFHRRYQKDGESLADFVIALKKLAMTCDFGEFLDAALRDRFVAGCLDAEIQRPLLEMDGSSKFGDVYKVALARELSTEQSKEVQRQSGPDATDVHRLWDRQDQEQQRQPGTVCSRCGSSAHEPCKCPFLKAKCFKFGKEGHVKRMCRGEQTRDCPASGAACFSCDRARHFTNVCRSRPRGDRYQQQLAFPVRRRASARNDYYRHQAKPGPTRAPVQGITFPDYDEFRSTIYTVASTDDLPERQPDHRRQDFTANVEFRPEAPLQCFRIDAAAPRTAVPEHLTKAEVPQPPCTADSSLSPNSSGACGTSNLDTSTVSARVDPGGYDSTLGGLATLPPCSSPATGDVERYVTLRRPERHGPGPQGGTLPPEPPVPVQPCLQVRLQFLQRSWNLCPRRTCLLGRLQTTAGHPAAQKRLLRV